MIASRLYKNDCNFLHKYNMLILSVFSYIYIVQYKYMFIFGGGVRTCVHVSGAVGCPIFWEC
jgi:hypothetical protein